jgi:tripartite ATP-independent transporter DctP family solute receptor
MKMSRTALKTVVLSTLLITGCRQGSDKIVLKLGHGLDQTHSVHLGMSYMAKLVAERTQGRVRIDIYPSEQLGSERELLEQLQVGALSMAKVSAAVLESFQPSMGLFNLPYIFADEDHYWRTLEGDIGLQLLDEGKKFGLKGLTYYDSGSRSFYTRDKAIAAPENLRGMKIRVQKSATAIEMIRAFGGSATPIAWGELYSALQQGVVDGAENNEPSFFLSKHYEVCKYYSLNEHTRTPDVLAMSLEVWNGIPADVQEILLTAAHESTSHQRQLWKESVRESTEGLKAAGVTITTPDKGPFLASVRDLLDRYEREKEYGFLIRKIRESQGPAVQ